MANNLDCLVCLDRANNAVLCPKCSKIFCADCVGRLYVGGLHDQLPTSNCPHCRARLLERDFVKVGWIDEIPESFVDKCRKHPRRYGSLHCVPCRRSFCAECRKADHHRDDDGAAAAGTSSSAQRHQVESVELLHEKVAETWERRKRDLAAMGGLIGGYREDEKRIEALRREGERRIDEIARDMKTRLREEVEGATSRNVAAHPRLDAFVRSSPPLVDAVESAADAKMLNRLVERRPELEKLGNMIDETMRESRGADGNLAYAVAMVPDVLSILEPWTPNYVIDEIVDIPKADPDSFIGVSRCLTSVGCGSLPPFVMVLLETVDQMLYARIVEGPPKLSNLEFVVESANGHTVGGKPEYRHVFIPQVDFVKGQSLDLGGRSNFHACCRAGYITRLRIRVRPRNYGQLPLMPTTDEDESEDGSEVREMSHEGDGVAETILPLSNNNNNDNNCGSSENVNDNNENNDDSDWIIDADVNIPKREFASSFSVSRPLTSVERGSQPPFVLQLMLSRERILYAKLLEGPQKLSNLEFVIESVTHATGCEPKRHIFIPREDFVKRHPLDLRWKDPSTSHFESYEGEYVQMRLRIRRRRNRSQLPLMPTMDEDGESEVREMSHESDGAAATILPLNNSNNGNCISSDNVNNDNLSNWIIDADVCIPKRAFASSFSVSRPLTSVERGSQPPFVMQLVLSRSRVLYAKLLEGPQKLSNLEFVVESATRTPVHLLLPKACQQGTRRKPDFRHVFVPQEDFVKRNLLDLRWRDAKIRRYEGTTVHLRVRVCRQDRRQLRSFEHRCIVIDNDSSDDETTENMYGPLYDRDYVESGDDANDSDDNGERGSGAGSEGVGGRGGNVESGSVNEGASGSGSGSGIGSMNEGASGSGNGSVNKSTSGSGSGIGSVNEGASGSSKIGSVNEGASGSGIRSGIGSVNEGASGSGFRSGSGIGSESGLERSKKRGKSSADGKEKKRQRYNLRPRGDIP